MTRADTLQSDISNLLREKIIELEIELLRKEEEIERLHQYEECD